MPCWLVEKVSELSSGCRRRSKTLTAGQRREMRRSVTSTKISWFTGFGNRSVFKWLEYYNG